MGFLGELTGKNAAKRAAAAAAESNRLLELARGEAGGYLDTSRTSQLDALGKGYAAGFGYLDDAEGSAAGYLNQGADRGRADIGQYYDRAAGNVEDYYNRTAGLMDPYIQRGNKLADLYATALGANGAEGSRDFYDQYASQDPFRQYRDELANREMQQQFNARGQATGGRFATAVSRASLERGSQDLNSYLDRLNGAGQQGQQAASTLGSAAMQTGQTLGNMNVQRGNQLSGIEQSRGQNLATNAANFGNARAGYGVQQGQNNAAVEQNYGNARSNLTMGVAQQQGNNLVGGAAAQNQARLGGLNNLFGLGSLALTGFTPGRNGTSPFGNMFGR